MALAGGSATRDSSSGGRNAEVALAPSLFFQWYLAGYEGLRSPSCPMVTARYIPPMDQSNRLRLRKIFPLKSHTNLNDNYT